MKKRLKLLVFSSILTVLFCSVAFGNQPALWEEFKSHFITQDGRVIDYYNGQISHSEGQGYGMLLSTMYNDKATFDKLWQWVKSNLGVRGDNLFAWKWGERVSGKWGVVDYNNATDGDILIAYALILADEKWPKNNYKSKGLQIVESLKNNLVINWEGGKFLLPGYYGFIKENGFVLNPSYFIFSAYRAFANVDDKATWDKIYKDSLVLLAKLPSSSLHLPADWIFLNGTTISLAPEKNPYFGYEAIRVLLYLPWEESPQFSKGLTEMLDIYKKLGYMPLWVDLANDSISMKPALAGFYAVYARAAERIGEKTLSEKLFKEAAEKLNYEKKDYYSFCLYLLAEKTRIYDK